ncbi:MAG: PfkB family carbohydrate kinase [Paracoccaceae bacterium]
MTSAPDILCIGSALWDVIGRASNPMTLGADLPGRIARLPGGVALNIAMTLRRFGLNPALLSAIGQDEEGEALIAACTRSGVLTTHVYRSPDLPTDRYMAVEGANGLIAAIADAHSLEAAGAQILRPLEDGRLGSASAPYPGAIALDGNLTEALLQEIAQSPLFASADLRVAPASPGKAARLLPLLDHPGATFYLNREEAGLICMARFDNAADAAETLVERGAYRALVTDGGAEMAMANAAGLVRRCPPQVMVTRVTGAGDTLMAGHIAAELGGASADNSLEAALRAAAQHITGKTPQ